METLCVNMGVLVCKLLKEILMETIIKRTEISEENGTGSKDCSWQANPVFFFGKISNWASVEHLEKFTQNRTGLEN